LRVLGLSLQVESRTITRKSSQGNRYVCAAFKTFQVIKTLLSYTVVQVFFKENDRHPVLDL